MITQAKQAGRKIAQALCFVAAGIVLGVGVGFHGRGKKWVWVTVDVVLALALLVFAAWLVWIEEGPHL